MDNLIKLCIAIGVLYFSPSLNSQDRPFITTWKTDNPGLSCDSCIEIPTAGGSYSYDIDWTNDGIYDELGVTGNVTHDYSTPGTYQVAIRGRFPRVLFAWHSDNDEDKIISIDQWGDIEWTSMEDAFWGCDSLRLQATDAPDLSRVTSADHMFQGTLVNSDLNHWDVSGIKTMFQMFLNATLFNGDLSEWDVSEVTNMTRLFQGTSFNQDISNWDVSNVIAMDRMFANNSHFNQDVSRWNVSNVERMEGLFQNAISFNQDISNWIVSKVQSMSLMFQNAVNFNADLSEWDVSQVERMEGMFSGAVNFSSDISDWDVSRVTSMATMFSFTDYNGNLDNWDVSKVTSTAGMFDGNRSFSGNLSEWQVDSVTHMQVMFRGAESFNGDISLWNTGNVTTTSDMFKGALAFNQDIGGWNLSNTRIMTNMFFDAISFNQNLNNWDVSQCSTMSHMFRGATNFNSNLSNWDFNSLVSHSLSAAQDMLDSCGMSSINYESTLLGWALNPNSPDSIVAGSVGLRYCDEIGRDILIEKGWQLSGDRKLTEDEGCFPSSTNELQESRTSIVPNPVTDVLNVDSEIHFKNYKVISSEGIVFRSGGGVSNGGGGGGVVMH